MERPLIGITSRFFNDGDSKFAVPNGVRNPYPEAVAAAGGAPVIIPLMEPGDWLDALYPKLGGVLISGGEDVNPARYGEMPHEKLGPVSDLRDSLEIPIIKRCYEDGKPLLAICRGMQIANVALGGSLYQDLPAQAPKGVNHSIEKAEWNDTIHDVLVVPGSRLDQILGSKRAKVNSFHHQGVKKLAEALRPSATSEDGLVEGFETHDASRFFIGVQCHPETLCLERGGLGELGRTWLRLFKAFVDAAAKSPK